MTFGSDSVCEFPADDVGDSIPSFRIQPRPDWRKRDMWKGPARFAEARWTAEPELTRALDIFGAAAILIVALPALIILAVLLKMDSPGPLFFVQQRLGRGGKFFPCIKFRTMCVNADVALKAVLANSAEARAEWARDHKLRNDPRTTRLGAVVRKLSLDEFPQLINILRGDMSLVGPRPIVKSEIERYGRYFDEYCRVRPGLTGLWQVSGRNDVTYRRRVSIDCYYVRNKSLMFDVSILLRTIPVVLGARGSY